MPRKINHPVSYDKLLSGLKQRIRHAQIAATLSVNAELVRLYWDLGREIVKSQKNESWGKSVVEKLAQDLKTDFSTVSGLSPSNLWRMRSFFLAYDKYVAKLAQPVRELGPPTETLNIPWGHNIVLLEKLKDTRSRLWYAGQTSKNGWSRAVLIHQIESELHLRANNTDNNFKKTLPTPTSDLARELIKDNYNLEFLDIHESIKERELESSLIANLKEFLLELGVGFAFVGNQYRLEVGGQDYYLDLLFYHTRLHAYVVVELKVDSFKPEYAGKMNFYLSAVDDLLKSDLDEPAIGILLCKEKNKIIVDYALRNSNKPIAVSDYSLKRRLPKAYQGELPTISELKRGLTSL